MLGYASGIVFDRLGWGGLIGWLTAWTALAVVVAILIDRSVARGVELSPPGRTGSRRS